MKIRFFKPTRIARHAGGLRIGACMHFPTSIWDGKCVDNPKGTDTTFTSILFCLSLLFWEFYFALDYNFQPLPEAECGFCFNADYE